MSIKTIGTAVVSNNEGVKKRINKAAEKLVFDVLQSTQYSTPIASTVRELVTNACDSQREKEIAIEIIDGEKKVEDYYITRTEDEYRDSNFNPSYYNKEYLSSENLVEVNYYEREGTGYCDVFDVLDRGVGIGQERLEGYLELGFSTKRNTAENFGAFGLGAKVPLSTGVDFYTVETVHNGKLFKFNCYAYKTDFLISKWDADGSTILSDGTVVYYKDVAMLNYTRVSFGVKRHNRTKFVDAVQDQLCYIPNVKFYYTYEDGHKSNKTLGNSVLYNSDNLILGESYAWSKPHILLVKNQGATTGINYGYVDFRELEMEQLWGSVAIKCPARQVYKDSKTGEEVIVQEGVDVTPSREKVIWNDHTKKFIQEAIERAAQDATNMIEESLDEKDFMTWVSKCRDVLYTGQHNNSALSNLGRIVDKEKLRPRFPGDRSIAYGAPSVMLKGYKVRNVRKAVKGGKISIEREESGWSQVNFDNLYFVSGNASKVKDMYLLQNGTLSIISEHHPVIPEFATKTQLAAFDAIDMARDSNWELIKDSKVIKWDYDELEVPKDFEDNLEAMEEAAIANISFANMSAEERRKLSGTDVLYTLRRPSSGEDKYSTSVESWVFDKVEAPLNSIKNSSIETFYGTKEDEALLKLAATICAPQVPRWQDIYPVASPWEMTYRNDTAVDGHPCFSQFNPVRFHKWNGGWPEGLSPVDAVKQTDIQIFKVSQKTAKVLKGSNAKHISEFFSIIENDKWTMHSKARQWLTGTALVHLPEWVGQLRRIDPQFGDVYDKLREYDKYQYYKNSLTPESEAAQDIIRLMKKMHEMQIFLESTDDSEQIKAKSLELFKVADIDCTIFNDEILQLSLYMEEYLEPLRPLFDSVHFYHNPRTKFWDEVEAYMKLKDRNNFNPPL